MFRIDRNLNNDNQTKPNNIAYVGFWWFLMVASETNKPCLMVRLLVAIKNQQTLDCTPTRCHQRPTNTDGFFDGFLDGNGDVIGDANVGGVSTPLSTPMSMRMATRMSRSISALMSAPVSTPMFLPRTAPASALMVPPMATLLSAPISAPIAPFPFWWFSDGLWRLIDPFLLIHRWNEYIYGF